MTELRTFKVRLRTRPFGGAVYVRVEDVLAWFAEEARQLRLDNFGEAQAAVLDDLAHSFRELRA